MRTNCFINKQLLRLCYNYAEIKSLFSISPDVLPKILLKFAGMLDSAKAVKSHIITESPTLITATATAEVGAQEVGAAVGAGAVDRDARQPGGG